jgi:HD-GYP domain-containing protein (c-di-GMP phosphodiesterase class II)
MKGEEIAVSSRLINLANVVEVFGRTGGVEAAMSVARERSGTQFDPDLVEVFCEQAPMVLAELDETPSWEAVIAAEPALSQEIAGEELGLALEAIGEFLELKSPSIMGHVHAVRELVTEAAASVGLPRADAAELRRAACAYDLGRLGVPNTVWDKPGSLTQAEQERVRLHPYLSERMLTCSPALERLGGIAVEHHERLDGSGYPRGVPGDQIGTSARLLAAADVYQAMFELMKRDQVYRRYGRTRVSAAPGRRSAPSRAPMGPGGGSARPPETPAAARRGQARARRPQAAPANGPRPERADRPHPSADPACVAAPRVARASRRRAAGGSRRAAPGWRRAAPPRPPRRRAR